jgi:KDO2-lipid IV(A) lauroyltransferase
MPVVGKVLSRSARYDLLYFVAKAGLLLVRLLPRRVGIALFGAFGAIAFSYPNRDKKRTVHHLRLIYGSAWSERQIMKTARGVYRELGKNIFDAFTLGRMTREELDRVVSCDPIDAFDEAYRQGKGVIAITAHTGCFEMLLHYFPVKGYRSFAIGRKLRDERLDEIIRGLRSGDDIKYMDRSEPARNIVRYLREGRLFGVLIDQDTAVEGVFAPFLGRLAYTPSGPVKLAMKTGVPLFVITTARRENDMHHVYIRGPVDLDYDGDFEAALIRNVATINGYIGETINRHPEQWVWMHKRWFRKPGTGAAA